MNGRNWEGPERHGSCKVERQSDRQESMEENNQPSHGPARLTVLIHTYVYVYPFRDIYGCPRILNSLYM